MTNKPTLSVGRELLEQSLSVLALSPSGLYRELRDLLDKPEYPRVSIVKAHNHTCACVVGDSGVCDCGAVVDGVAVEVKPAAQQQCEPVAEVYRGPVSGISRIRWVNSRTQPVGAKLYAEQPAPVAVVMPFAEKIIAKLQRFEACVSDGQDVDIDRHWFDVLTHLGLLNRVQRSPALWGMTQQGEDALQVARLNGVKP